MVSWVEAVKEFAKQNQGKFVIPKKDTPEYLKIKAIQEKMSKAEASPPVKGKKEKVKRPNVEEVKSENVDVEPVQNKPLKPKPAKRENLPVVKEPVAVEPPVQKLPKKTRKEIQEEKKKRQEEIAIEVSKQKGEKALKDVRSVIASKAAVPVKVIKPKKETNKRPNLEEVKSENVVEPVQNKPVKTKPVKRANDDIDPRLIRISNEPYTMTFE